jgi:hypothetical protein
VTAGVQRDDVLAALRPEDVADHLGIKGQWRGRWLRSRRCAEDDSHSTEAFALNRETGRWHCHSCDKGGDLLHLIALGAGLNIKDDFPKVLEVAAEIAGVTPVNDGSDMFGIAEPRRPVVQRPPMAELPPLPDRIALAKKVAAWTWDKLYTNADSGIPAAYMKERGLDPGIVLSRETVRSTPMRISKELRAKIEERAPDISPEMRTLWWTMGVRKGTMSIALPIRCVTDGRLVDIRCRRVAPLEDLPKIIGMVASVTEAPAERGKTRRLVGCYGNPHAIDADHVVIVEGALDYLTALQVWPDAQVLGAVNAGSLALVTQHAAAALAERDSTSKLTIVEQCDPPRKLKDGKVVPGAADQSINEDPNAATKVAVRLLGDPKRVGWLFCDLAGETVDGKPVKDLNDLVRAGANIHEMHRWWLDTEVAW